MSDSHVVELLEQGTDMLCTLMTQVEELHGRNCPLFSKLCRIHATIKEAELRLNGKWFVEVEVEEDNFNEEEEEEEDEEESQAEQPKEQHEEEEEILPGSRKYPFSRLIKITKDGKEKRFYFRYRRRYILIKGLIQRIHKLQPSLKLDEAEKLIEIPREKRSEILQDALNFQKEVQKLLPSEDPDIQELVNRTDELVEAAQEAVQELGK